MHHPQLRCLCLVLSAMSLAGCSDTDGPLIASFEALPASVAAGASTQLRWQVQGAVSISVSNLRTGDVLAEDADSSGAVTTGPLRQTTAFALVASNDQAQVSRTITVGVTANNAPVVERFAATPQTILPGGSSSLQWSTSGAVQVSIEANGAVVHSGSGPSGEVQVQPDVSTSYTLVARGANGQQSQAMALVSVAGEQARPRVRSFIATPNPITEGDSATLSWQVQGASRVLIRQGATELSDSGDLMGSLSVNPGSSTTYTLLATNPEGQEEATVNVIVNPSLGARIEAFAANPGTVALGQPSALAWTVSNADRVEISAGGRTATVSTALSGTLSVSPVETTEYTLTALHSLGSAEARATVQVSASAPVIQDFSASPNPQAVGGRTTLSWQTVGADHVQLLRGQTLLRSSAQAMGSLSVPVTSTSTTYTLRASNSDGSNVGTVLVYGHIQPSIDDFRATPTSFLGTTTATLSWRVRDAQTLELYDDAGPVAGFLGLSTAGAAIDDIGQFAVQVSRSTEFRLVATSLAGQQQQRLTIFQQVPESEPNDSAMSAQVILTSGAPALGQLTANDEDWYVVDVPQGGFLRAWTDDGQAGCEVDTLIEVYTRGSALLVTDDDDGPGLCSLVDPNRDAALRDLGAGLYAIRVLGRSASDIGRYVLHVDFGAAGCGNGWLEATEQCDDGNTRPNDGCSPSCAIEPEGSFSAPGAARTLSGALQPIGEVDLYRLDVIQEAYVDVRTFTDARNRSCNAADTVIRLLASDARTELAQDDDDGVDRCSHINPATDAFARLGPGTYFLQVEEFGNNASVPAYDLVVTSVPANVCGNGVLEGLEQCDDGNTSPGDGCNASCVFTGLSENEAAGNDSPMGPGVTTVSADVVLRGALNPAGDSDWWAVSVPPGHSLQAYVTVDSFTTCPRLPQARLRLFDVDGVTVLGSDDRSGPDSNCAQLGPANDADLQGMSGGTYFFEVREDSTPQTPIGTYFLHVRIIAPGCGNGLLEPAEACDDGNLSNGDGCNAACELEAQGVYLGPGAAQLYSGTLNPATKVDAYRLTLGVDSYIFAETFTSTAPAACTADTRLQLLASDGLTEIGSDDADGLSSCSQIDASRDPWAQLSAGQYWLTVQEDARDAIVPQYFLALLATPVGVCGNRVIEAGEGCDDGNTQVGDGCDAVCAVEARGIYAAPSGPQTFGPFALAVGTQDSFRIDVSATSYLSAETFTDAALSTCSHDTLIRLRDAQGAELGLNDEGGINSCSRIDPLNDAFTRLSTGTYFLVVEEFGNDAAIPRYEVQFSSVPVDICGNGVTELGETCDDGNLMPGDGCNATCQVEGIIESEPNSDRATANASGLSALGTVTLAGSVGIGGDQDYFWFDVPAGGADLRAITYTSPGNPASCAGATDTRIFLQDAAGAALADDDDGNPSGTGLCSLINRPGLAAGRYYIFVQHWDNDAPAAFPYFMDLRLQ